MPLTNQTKSDWKLNLNQIIFEVYICSVIRNVTLITHESITHDQLS